MPGWIREKIRERRELWRPKVPEGRQGPWVVERFAVTTDGAALASFQSPRRSIPPGTYTRLRRTGGFGPTGMSDTPAEYRDHSRLFMAAEDSPEGAKVLIHGLGLGCALAVVASMPHVVSVTVVEKDPDVVALVWPHHEAQPYTDKLALVLDDALTWEPPKGARWDVVWHDIWPAITSDNLDAMRRLHRRFGRRSDWQGSWCRAECERQHAEFKRERRAWR